MAWLSCERGKKNMIGNALILTIALLLALSFWLMESSSSVIPYKAVLIHAYGTPLFLFLSGLFESLCRSVRTRPDTLLKDTGRKLSHLDKQMQVGQGELPAPSIDTIDGNNEELG